MIFVSYAHSNSIFVNRLALELSLIGGDVWMDSTHSLPGSSLWATAESAINSSEAVVLVASNASLSSDYVLKELKIHADSAETGRKLLILPLEDVRGSKIPDKFRDIVRLPLNKSLAQYAHLVHNSLGGLRSSENPSIWVQWTPGGMRHPFSQPPSAWRSATSLVMLGPDGKVMTDEIIADASREFFAGSPELSEWAESQARYARQWQKSATVLADNCIALHDHSDKQSRFRLNFALEALRHITARLWYTRIRLTPISANEDIEKSIEEMHGADPCGKLNHDGIEVNLQWGDFLVNSKCPPYVKPIDLPPIGMLPATSVLPHDLGRMAGDGLIASNWGNKNMSEILALDNLPKIEDVFMGPA